MTSEVIAENVSIFANVAEVHAAAARLEEKQPIKVGDERVAGLVNSDEDCLTCLGELAEEPHDVGGGLSIEA